MDTTRGFECCQSFVGKCFNPGPGEKKGETLNLETCERMMKQFFASKDTNEKQDPDISDGRKTEERT